MKKTELKKILKPLIKDCIKEVIFEDGVLSGIISEVAQGLSKGPIVEQQHAPVVNKTMPTQDNTAIRQQLAETKRKMLDAIGKDAYGGVDLFEGTNAMSTSGRETAGSMANPMSGRDPNDPGVDISGIMSLGGQNCGAHLKDGKE